MGPIAKLEFKLPEEREEFNTAVEAGVYKSIISDFDNDMRKLRKHREFTKEELEVFKEIDQMWIDAKDGFCD